MAAKNISFLVCFFILIRLLGASGGPVPVLKNTPPLLFGEQEQDTKPPPADKKPAVDEILQFEKLVSRQRGLEFKQPVQVGFKDKEELKKIILADYEKDGVKKEMPKINKALVKFGLLPPELDINKFIVALLTEQVAGFYNPKTKELCLIKETDTAENMRFADSSGRPVDVSFDELAIVHEMTHAVQDQHFDLSALPINDTENDDRASAVQAVVEGEANFIMYDYLLKKLGQDIDLQADFAVAAHSEQSGKATLMDDAPLYIREGLLFPYLQGLVFIHNIKTTGGWEKVNRLYTDLPVSTEQILHPEKYWAVPRDNPAKITLPDFSGILAGQWEVLLKNVMGELNTGILFRQFLPQLQTAQLAEGWDGDRFAVWENPTNRTVLLLWFTAWDSPKDAGEFASGYTRLIKKKYPDLVELENSDRLDNQEPPAARSWTSRDNFIFIEKKEDDVLIIESPSADLLVALRNKTWAEVKKEEKQ